jgi:2-polyprenyl-3-methyl-5-hydroxy-6-metoxy-1,4-benzoquinol methylase
VTNEAQEAYLDTRFRPDPRRDVAWHHIVTYLEKWWDPERARILDVGAGYCSFVNNVRGSRRVAVDIHPRLDSVAAPGVETFQSSATDLSAFEDHSFDIVFASNLLEHLERDAISVALTEFRRVLSASGRLMLMQPNFRLSAKHYFDDYTHLTPLSDRSLADVVVVAGFRVIHLEPRFLPLTLKSQGSRFTFLIPSYLRLPWRPFAGQLLLVAEAAK